MLSNFMNKSDENDCFNLKFDWCDLRNVCSSRRGRTEQKKKQTKNRMPSQPKSVSNSSNNMNYYESHSLYPLNRPMSLHSFRLSRCFCCSTSNKLERVLNDRLNGSEMSWLTSFNEISMSPKASTQRKLSVVYDRFSTLPFCESKENARQSEMHFFFSAVLVSLSMLLFLFF